MSRACNTVADTREPTPMEKRRDLSIIIPAYNEEGAIRQTIEEIGSALGGSPVDYEVVVVDDGSSDRTREIAGRSGARVISNTQNRGYGASLKRGILGTDSEYVAIIDADGTYPASALPAIIETARSADMVVGARDTSMTNVPFLRRPAKYIVNALANFLARRKIPDLNSGLRVFRRSSLVPFLPLLPNGFSFTTTITLCMIGSELTVEYIPIEYRKRVGKSSMRAREFFNFLLLVLRSVVLFSPLRVFLPLGAVLFAFGSGKFIYDVFIGNLSESAVLGILAAIMIWAFGLIADMVARLHLRR